MNLERAAKTSAGTTQFVKAVFGDSPRIVLLLQCELPSLLWLEFVAVASQIVCRTFRIRGYF